MTIQDILQKINQRRPTYIVTDPAAPNPWANPWRDLLMEMLSDYDAAKNTVDRRYAIERRLDEMRKLVEGRE